MRSAHALSDTLAAAHRPIVALGSRESGLPALDGDRRVARAALGLPFVSSWAGLTYFNHDHPGFLGQIGVYGNRGANFALQNADTVIVLGSRLDNRQRSGNAKNFAIGATVHVVDIDAEELRKYRNDGYRTSHIDFRELAAVLKDISAPELSPEWLGYVQEMKARYYGQEDQRRCDPAQHAVALRCGAPAQRGNRSQTPSSSATPAQRSAGFTRPSGSRNTRLFTAGGNSPMGYALAGGHRRKARSAASTGDLVQWRRRISSSTFKNCRP